MNPEKGSLYAILAYGTGKVAEDSKLGMPLVAGASSAGYAADYHNGEGPVKLVVPARTEEEANAAACLGSVVGVEVTANEIDTWGHAMSDVYSEFLDYEMTFTIRNDDHEWTHNFTVAQLESLTDLIVREEYAVLEIGTCEGIDYPDLRAFTVQFHPEACTGPKDTSFLFDQFVDLMKGGDR